jgi:hypothetical protein
MQSSFEAEPEGQQLSPSEIMVMGLIALGAVEAFFFFLPWTLGAW